MNDQLTRIEKLLERIADALEKQNEPDIEVKMAEDAWNDFLGSESVKRRRDIRGRPIEYDKPYDTPIRFVIDYCLMGDDKTAETCRATFDGMPNFGKSPDTQSTHINIKCRNANEFREQYMQQPKVDDSE